MFRIRSIYDVRLSVDRVAVASVQDILRKRFPGLAASEIDQLPELLTNPLLKRYRSILLVAENERAQVRGFALLCHFPDLRFCYLDFISVNSLHGGGGVGSALYERVREEAQALGDTALFFECLPDDPALCASADTLKENATRLAFYERFGARPIVGTAYETPLEPDGDCPPYLVVDPLGKTLKMTRERIRSIVRAILTRKYGDVCTPEYTDMVVSSFKGGVLALREPIYVMPEMAPEMLPEKSPKKSPETSPDSSPDNSPDNSPEKPQNVSLGNSSAEEYEQAVTPTAKRTRPAENRTISADRRIALVCNDKHDIHHVRERGYVEAPVRVSKILSELRKTDLFQEMPVRQYPQSVLSTVHDRNYVDYLHKVCSGLKDGTSVYPYVFPVRNAARPPRELAVRAGYYCLDTFTPLNANAWKAAKRAVDCGLTAADALLEGRRLAYALVRPPGHHAERKAFGGFCYFNTAAVAAHRLSAYGPVAVLDVDYHHGNGTQNIFYERNDVLTVSIHGHPRFAYPYFSGFSDETGAGAGEGFNRNFPLLETVDGTMYRNTLSRALAVIRDFAPMFLVLSLGLDPAKGDPTGTWTLNAKDFTTNGTLIGGLGVRTLVVQEGGYRIRSLGVNARSFFQGLFTGAEKARR